MGSANQIPSEAIQTNGDVMNNGLECEERWRTKREEKITGQHRNENASRNINLGEWTYAAAVFGCKHDDRRGGLTENFFDIIEKTN